MEKTFFILIICSLPLFSFAQEPIAIKFYNGEQLIAQDAFISNHNHRNVPYILLNKKAGPYFSIDEIESLEGMDKKGRERYVIPVINDGNSIFAQRLFHSQEISIYYTGLTDFDDNFIQRNNYFKYTLHNSVLQEINIKNLQMDLGENKISLDYLQKAKRIRNLQAAIYVIGAGLIAHGLLSMRSEVNELVHMNKTASIPATFIAGALVVNIPSFFNKSKRKNMINALKEY